MTTTLSPVPADVADGTYDEQKDFAADALGVPVQSIEYVAMMEDGLYVVEA